jgi:hypothetical protein
MGLLHCFCPCGIIGLDDYTHDPVRTYFCAVLPRAQFEGQYKDNKFHGFGVYTTRRGKYEGEFYNGLKHGRGRMEWYSSGVYTGKWTNGYMHGPGKYVSLDGKEYEGDWRKNQREGKGVELLVSGERYEVRDCCFQVVRALVFHACAPSYDRAVDLVGAMV